jgi:hypothetical protein
MAHRVAPEAEAELDSIWYYVAKESGSIEVADRLIDSIIEGMRICVLACAVFPWASMSSSLALKDTTY